MEEKKRDFNVPDPSEICGDGSCGCGCGFPMEMDKVLSQEETQKIPSSPDEESLETARNTTREERG